MKTSVLAAVTACMCLSLGSARATPSSTEPDPSDEPTSTPTTDLLSAPLAMDVLAAADGESGGALGGHAGASAVARGSGPNGTYTLADTMSWMHADTGPISAWAQETALDRPEIAARIAMWAPALPESAGGAIALSSAGSGGGAPSENVSVHVATVGHGDADTEGSALGPRGVGVAADGTERGHRGARISLRDVDVDVGHGLPRAIVQGVVRQNFARMSACYGVGLRDKPTLHGRVAVKFVIGEDGSVELAQDAGSALPDDAVVNCVVRNFQVLTFPPPEGGKVTVTYPLVFAPQPE